MKKHIIIWAMAMVLAAGAKAQQDTQLTQYIFNGIYINPAYTGYKGEVFIQSCFRSQWVGVNGAPQSSAIAIDGALNNEKVGLGLMLNSDQVGAQNVLSGYVNYAYRIQIGADETSRLSFGLAGGLMQLSLDGNKLNAITPGDQAIPIASQSTVIPDANFGVYYANSKYFAGVSATNLMAKINSRNYNSSLLVPIPQPHVYLTAGTFITINNEVRFKPVVLFKDDFKGPTTMDIDGFILMNERFVIGGFYRSSVKLYPKNNLQSDLPSQNAFGGIVEFFASSNIRIGYSYDHSLNSLGNYGSHELSIGFYISNRSSGQGSALRCYKF